MNYDNQIDKCHCFASRRSARHISRLYDRHLANANIKSSQFSLLVAIDFNPGIQIAQLAELMVMDRTTLVRALKPLQDEGLIISTKAEKIRALMFHVTPTGKRKIKECEPFWQSAQAELEHAFGDDSAQMLRQKNLAISSTTLSG